MRGEAVALEPLGIKKQGFFLEEEKELGLKLFRSPPSKEE